MCVCVCVRARACQHPPNPTHVPKLPCLPLPSMMRFAKVNWAQLSLTGNCARGPTGGVGWGGVGWGGVGKTLPVTAASHRRSVELSSIAFRRAAAANTHAAGEHVEHGTGAGGRPQGLAVGALGAVLAACKRGSTEVCMYVCVCVCVCARVCVCVCVCVWRGGANTGVTRPDCPRKRRASGAAAGRAPHL